MIKKNKKAMFFTISTILLIGLILAQLKTIYNEDFDIIRDEKRVTTMNYYLDDIENDIVRAAQIIGTKAMIAIVTNIIETNSFSNDPKKQFKELFLENKLNGIDNKIMNNTNIYTWIKTNKKIAASKNMELEIKINNVNIEHNNPWNIQINIDTEISLSSNTANYKYNKTIYSDISIIGLEDPNYALNTNNQISNYIKTTSIINPKSDLLNHVYSHEYITNTLAPDFLDRLKGKTSASKYGIESLVDIPLLIQNSISIKEKTIVDYLYFSDISKIDSNIIGMPVWLRIDQEHLNTYS